MILLILIVDVNELFYDIYFLFFSVRENFFIGVVVGVIMVFDFDIDNFV